MYNNEIELPNPDVGMFQTEGWWEIGAVSLVLRLGHHTFACIRFTKNISYLNCHQYDVNYIWDKVFDLISAWAVHWSKVPILTTRLSPPTQRTSPHHATRHCPTPPKASFNFSNHDGKSSPLSHVEAMLGVATTMWFFNVPLPQAELAAPQHRRHFPQNKCWLMKIRDFMF